MPRAFSRPAHGPSRFLGSRGCLPFPCRLKEAENFVEHSNCVAKSLPCAGPMLAKNKRILGGVHFFASLPALFPERESPVWLAPYHGSEAITEPEVDSSIPS